MVGESAEVKQGVKQQRELPDQAGSCWDWRIWRSDTSPGSYLNTREERTWHQYTQNCTKYPFFQQTNHHQPAMNASPFISLVYGQNSIAGKHCWGQTWVTYWKGQANWGLVGVTLASISHFPMSTWNQSIGLFLLVWLDLWMQPPFRGARRGAINLRMTNKIIRRALLFIPYHWEYSRGTVERAEIVELGYDSYFLVRPDNYPLWASIPIFIKWSQHLLLLRHFVRIQKEYLRKTPTLSRHLINGSPFSSLR